MSPESVCVCVRLSVLSRRDGVVMVWQLDISKVFQARILTKRAWHGRGRQRSGIFIFNIVCQCYLIINLWSYLWTLFTLFKCCWLTCIRLHKHCVNIGVWFHIGVAFLLHTRVMIMCTKCLYNPYQCLDDVAKPLYIDFHRQCLNNVKRVHLYERKVVFIQDKHNI